VSDFIRRANGVEPPRPAVAAATTKELARLCHEAEDMADDVLLVEVTAETERREHERPGTLKTFMDWYWILWRERRR
jgi:hypothetical protein